MRSNVQRFDVTFEVTRPNDVIAYAVGDQVANSTSPGSVTMLRVPIGYSGIGITLTPPMAVKSNVNITNADFMLLLFNSPPTNAGDNIAYAPGSTLERESCFGRVLFGNPQGIEANLGGGVFYRPFFNGQSQITHLSTVLKDGSIYGVLTANAAYTPVANEIFTIRMSAEVR